MSYVSEYDLSLIRDLNVIVEDSNFDPLTSPPTADSELELFANSEFIDSGMQSSLTSSMNGQPNSLFRSNESLYPSEFWAEDNVPSGGATTIGPQKPCVVKNSHDYVLNEQAAKIAAYDDKRQRNVVASARFRARKKERERAIKEEAKSMHQTVVPLELHVQKLEFKNEWLKKRVKILHAQLVHCADLD